jgi:hypothetical protein
MQKPPRLRRPALKARRVPRHRCKPAVVQPLLHLLLLRQPRKQQLFPLPRRQSCALRGRFGARCGHEAGAHEKDAPRRDERATREGGAQVDTLPGGAGGQVGVSDGVVRVRVVDARGGELGEGVVVQQDEAAGNAVGGPVVHAAFGGGGGDVGPVGEVVEEASRNVGELCCVLGEDKRGKGGGTYVAEAVPLGAALGVEVVEVVVGDIFAKRFDFMLECFAAERRGVWFMERETVIINQTRVSITSTEQPPLFSSTQLTLLCQKDI